MITWPKCVVYFVFASAFLYENVCLLIFLLGVKIGKVDVMMYAETHDFAITIDWQGINELPLCLGVDKTHTICS